MRVFVVIVGNVGFSSNSIRVDSMQIFLLH